MRSSQDPKHHCCSRECLSLSIGIISASTDPRQRFIPDDGLTDPIRVAIEPTLLLELHWDQPTTGTSHYEIHAPTCSTCPTCATGPGPDGKFLAPRRCPQPGDHNRLAGRGPGRIHHRSDTHRQRNRKADPAAEFRAGTAIRIPRQRQVTPLPDHRPQYHSPRTLRNPIGRTLRSEHAQDLPGGEPTRGDRGGTQQHASDIKTRPDQLDRQRPHSRSRRPGLLPVHRHDRSASRHRVLGRTDRLGTAPGAATVRFRWPAVEGQSRLLRRRPADRFPGSRQRRLHRPTPRPHLHRQCQPHLPTRHRHRAPSGPGSPFGHPPRPVDPGDALRLEPGQPHQGQVTGDGQRRGRDQCRRGGRRLASADRTCPLANPV